MTTTSRAARAGQTKPLDSEIDIFGLTHQGKVRKENQDHFLVCQLKKQIQVHFTSLPDVDRLSSDMERLAFLILVADGVGGGARGETASRLAVEAVTRYLTDSIHIYYTSDPKDDSAFAQALAEAARACHEDLLRYAAQDPAGQTMATTLTLFISLWPRAYLVQVGDSRYYLFKDDGLIQVSRDQTIAQDLIDTGALTRDDAARTRWANVLSSAIGGSEATPVVTRIDHDRSYIHLFCSDGLTKHVSDEQIAHRLRTMTSSRQVCEALVQDALDDGGTDNVTVVVARLVER